VRNTGKRAVSEKVTNQVTDSPRLAAPSETGFWQPHRGALLPLLALGAGPKGDGHGQWPGVASSIAAAFLEYEAKRARLPAAAVRERLEAVAGNAGRLLDNLRAPGTFELLAEATRESDLYLADIALALDELREVAAEHAKAAGERATRRRTPDTARRALLFRLDRVFDCFCPLPHNSKRRAVLRRDFIVSVLAFAEVECPKDLERWIACPQLRLSPRFCQEKAPTKA